MCTFYVRIKIKENRKQNVEGKKDKLCQISNIWFPLKRNWFPLTQLLRHFINY
jgi:hypothetical protein